MYNRWEYRSVMSCIHKRGRCHTPLRAPKTQHLGSHASLTGLCGMGMLVTGPNNLTPKSLHDERKATSFHMLWISRTLLHGRMRTCFDARKKSYDATLRKGLACYCQQRLPGGHRLQPHSFNWACCQFAESPYARPQKPSQLPTSVASHPEVCLPCT
jgi:hypothetical protein